MENLPNDILDKIVDQIDLVSFIRLNACCRKFRDGFGLGWKLSKLPIQYLNKLEHTSATYGCLNSMIDDIVGEFARCDPGATLYKEYTTSRHQQQYTLQIHRNIKKNKSANYSFIIRKGNKNYPQFQFIYDPTQESYIGIRNIMNEFRVPLLFVFIGCRVLFKIHGYCDVKSFKNLPEWFTRALFSKKYNGYLYRDITNGFAII